MLTTPTRIIAIGAQFFNAMGLLEFNPEGVASSYITGQSVTSMGCYRKPAKTSSVNRSLLGISCHQERCSPINKKLPLKA